MEKNKLSYISWTVIVAAVLILAGWFITSGSKANLKTYQNDKVKIEFEYAKEWNNMITDKAVDKLIQLQNPQVYILINNLKISPMGMKSGQSAFNRITFESYEELGSEKVTIGKQEAVKISFTYVENGNKMQACEVLIPVAEKDMVTLGIYGPEADIAIAQEEFDDIVKSISIKN